MANTRAPPNATWNAAETGGVSMYFQRTQLITASSTTTTRDRQRGRGPEIGDQERQRVADAAQGGHQAGDRATDHRRAASGQAAVVRQRLGERHGDAGADRGRHADQEGVPVTCRWRTRRRTPAPAWRPSRPSAPPDPAGSPAARTAAGHARPRRRGRWRAGSRRTSWSARCSCSTSASARSPSSLRIEASVECARRRGGRSAAVSVSMLSARSRTASRFERLDLPDRLVLDEAAHVLAADQRDVLAELLAVELDQPAAVLALLAGHLGEHVGAGRGNPARRPSAMSV